MTSHPNRGHTYWEKHPRDFANELIIGIATTQEDAEQYAAEGFDRISRERVLSEPSRLRSQPMPLAR